MHTHTLLFCLCILYRKIIIMLYACVCCNKCFKCDEDHGRFWDVTIYSKTVYFYDDLDVYVSDHHNHQKPFKERWDVKRGSTNQIC